MGLVSDVLMALRGGAAADEAVTVDLERPDGAAPTDGIKAVVERMVDTIAEAVCALPPGEEVPDGWLMDAAGRLNRIASVRESDRLQDEVARSLALEGVLLHELLRAYKARALDALSDLVSTVAKEYGVQMGGERGNLSLTSFDGQWKVQRIYRDVLSFGPAILAAKTLIDECITRWSEGADNNIRILIDRAFRADKKGDLRTGPVLELLRVKIEDEQWQQAMQALSDAIEITGSAVYVRVYRRTSGDQYVPVPIDLAVV